MKSTDNSISFSVVDNQSRNLLFVWICLAQTVLLAFFPALTRANKLPKLDPKRLQSVGVRTLTGKHIQLYTDLPASERIEELPVAFDAAVKEWAEYFQVPERLVQRWHMRAYLIQDRNKFIALGLLHEGLPDFANGFASAKEIWLYEQPSDYYRRHLLLHEGTHGFMHALLGGVGPGWYAEGMAELFGTHSWQDGKLSMRQMPPDKESVPMWGRIKSLREAYDAGEALSLEAVLKLDGKRTLSTDEYAWCWAVCKFLDSHPRWLKKFRRLYENVQAKDFNTLVHKAFGRDWPVLEVEWQAFIADLDYGYDSERMAMQHMPKNRPTEGQVETISAKQGWQATSWLFEAGKHYSIEAEGRYIIAQEEQPWPCEPGGITLEYHKGYPLGMLLGAWRTNTGKFSPPFPIGLKATLKPTQPSKLYLRVNDSPAKLSDNRGDLSIRIAAEQADND